MTSKTKETLHELQSQIEVLSEERRPYVLTVKLNHGIRPKYIGHIDCSGEGTFISKRKPKHLFRKLNALGVNYELLTNPEFKFKWISIIFKGCRYETTREYLLKKGVKHQFKNSGCEMQVFLPLELFGKEKAKKFTNDAEEKQLSFFAA